MSGIHPSAHARSRPDHIAYKMVPSGQAVTYGQLEERSNQAAHLLRSLGLKRGDVIAILMENHLRYFELSWAADRAGIYYTCISNRLTPAEAAYIVSDSGASVLFTSLALRDVATDVLALVPGCVGYNVDGTDPVLRDYMAEREKFPVTPIADESCGTPMLYSSGTTGRPKGVKFALPEQALDEMDGLTSIAVNSFGFGSDMIYLSPAPMYHSAPLRWSMCAHRVGGTVIVMEKFDAEYGLALIEQERVTHSQWVPTHFVRMLKLPEDARTRYDLSSHRLTFHAAAPCPVPVKQAMMAWWGPIIHEFYAGTEFNGLTSITPEEWLAHPGSVGKATFGQIHICADDGVTELPTRSEGLIYFSGGMPFTYHNDPEKTRDAYNALGWSTLGDIGWVDEEGYLYLTDRKSFMVISGGVNVYPQEIEDAIIGHPKVADAAVVGAPDEDLGERLVAVIQPLDWADAGPGLADEIQVFLADKLSKLKIPRQIDFMVELPRHPTGKLYKRLLRDGYWTKAEAKDASRA
ncbi:acyl-CoA synthetase [Sphingopyxis sp. GW247-27LB]|uniref:acyl-CoA synthetase n=1 Tax=Sphingopyxis sp. GW247-27LB TaxID=2012632 RepID=UPI001C3E910D|nr:acyl-CoA synthetase [Sphingopyxis sp. GW247-27LB]